MSRKWEFYEGTGDGYLLWLCTGKRILPASIWGRSYPEMVSIPAPLPLITPKVNLDRDLNQVRVDST